MAYVRRNSKSRVSRTSNRRSNYSSLGKSRRTSKFTKARSLKKLSTRKRAIAGNARAIKKLKFNQWGRIQSQVATTSPAIVTSGHPLLFHVNNPLTDNHGPYIWHVNMAGQVATMVPFVKHQSNSTHEFDSDMEHEFPNGPTLKMLRATYQFKFSGFVDDTRVRIDFIRQKRLDTDYWNQNEEKQFLPHSLVGLKHLAGFSPHELDKRCFQVLGTKHIYLNSKASRSTLDMAQDQDTVEGNTPPTKYCRVSLPLNKVFRQLNTNAIGQQTASDFGTASGQVPSDRNGQYGSSWAYDNQHPLKNIFCLISCDDQTAFDAALTGDAVKVEIIRKLTWQDRL